MSGTAEPPAVDAPSLELPISRYRAAVPAMQEQRHRRKRRAKEILAVSKGYFFVIRDYMIEF
jgi:hypothetical protein